MKIGIDARFWSETGVGRYIKNLVVALEKNDKDNTYILFVTSKDKDVIASVVNPSKFSLVVTDIAWHSVEEQIHLAKVIKAQKLDLMHFTYFSVPLFYTGKYILTIHDLILHHFPTGQASTLPLPVYYAKWAGYKFIISAAAKKAKHIIAVSQSTKEEIIDHLSVNKDKISVIYEGVDKAVVASQPKEVSFQERYYLHVGNVYPHKNARLLVDAFENRDDTSLKLYFVGKKDFFMKKLEEYALDKKISNIQFKGYVSDAVLSDLYREALATVVPSKMEGFGLPALEAMANSCLVVASGIDSLKEVTKGKAIFFTSGDKSSLINVLNTIAKAEKNEYASQKNEAKKVAESYSWDQMAKETIEQYKRCNSL